MGVNEVIAAQFSDPCCKATIRTAQLLAQVWHMAYKPFTQVSGCLGTCGQSSPSQRH